MLIYLLCLLAGIGLFYGIPRALRATGLKKVYLGMGVEFHSPEDNKQAKKLDDDDEPPKKLKQ